ncbi:MAG: MFS transporter [Bryobacterales bacterium]|nr:MFS transporter [Bryobacterales bacterium]
MTTKEREGRNWAVVGLLCVGFTIAYVDRTNLSIALASPEFKRLFQLTDTQRGLLNSAFFWSYALLQVPAGYFTDRYGVRLPYAASFLLWSAVSAASAMAGSFWHLFALRLLLGVGEAMVTPASLRWIKLHIGEQHRGLAVGILFAGSKFGPAIGADLAVRLIGSYGWRGMFVILGLGSLVFLLPWFLLVKDDDRQIEAELEKKTGGKAIPFAAIWKTPAIYGIILGAIAYNYFNYFCLTWLPSYFVERWQLSLAQMGAFTAFTYLGMAGVAIGAGAAADRLVAGGRNPVAVRKAFSVAGLLLASTQIVGSLPVPREVALGFAFFSLAGLGLTTANYWALTQSIMPGAAIGRISGVQNLANNISGIVAPALTGWLIQRTGGYAAAQQAILVVLVSGVFGYLVLVREKFAPKG